MHSPYDGEFFDQNLPGNIIFVLSKHSVPKEPAKIFPNLEARGEMDFSRFLIIRFISHTRLPANFVISRLIDEFG